MSALVQTKSIKEPIKIEITNFDFEDKFNYGSYDNETYRIIIGTKRIYKRYLEHNNQTKITNSKMDLCYIIVGLHEQGHINAKHTDIKDDITLSQEILYEAEANSFLYKCIKPKYHHLIKECMDLLLKGCNRHNYLDEILSVAKTLSESK
ncbi:MAG: hypothetical protein M0R17_05020 [Candidatus Omnitrophica bacterium]|jgi:hypothetical protein|nr:hypothetical protein [Candidatus Omnitrophota bacterium]